MNCDKLFLQYGIVSAIVRQLEAGQDAKIRVLLQYLV